VNSIAQQADSLRVTQLPCYNFSNTDSKLKANQDLRGFLPPGKADDDAGRKKNRSGAVF
jgi:hypothetical protein